MTPVYQEVSEDSLSNKNNFGVEKIPFGEYLFQRLLSIGTKSIFGVPGDFNLPLLEYLYEPTLIEQGLRWIGSCNELNAAYAADGYSRYSNKIGCLITTYGVGELSAMNGIAGSFAENVKVLHIVGVVRSTDSIKSSNNSAKNVHHLVPSLKDSNFKGPNHKVYYEMVKNKISCSTEYLDDIDTACDKVDKVIKDIYKYSKPGYIFVPVDFVNMPVNIINLIETPTIHLDMCIPMPSLGLLDTITNFVLNEIYNSKTPAIIGDVLTDRFGGNKLLNELIELTNIWNFTTVNGKSIINESNSNYMGLYNGAEGLASVTDRFSQCDLILNFGIDINEINHGHYTFNYKKGAILIEFHPTYIRFFDTSDGKEKVFKHVNFIPVLKDVVQKLNPGYLKFDYNKSVQPFSYEEGLQGKNINDSKLAITQSHLARVMPPYFNPGDVLVSDTGSFQFAIRDMLFPNQFKYMSQGFYLSIGTALPLALGVGIAMQDFPRIHITDNSIPENYKPRLILFEGDGAAQMTVQELSTMIKNEIPIEIFLWENNGYTVERAILGPTRTYNDIMFWDWTKLLQAFGDIGEKISRSTKIETTSKLALKLKELKNRENCKTIEFVEVKLGTLDYPQTLHYMVEAAKVKQRQETLNVTN